MNPSKMGFNDYFIIKDHTGFQKIVRLGENGEEDEVLRVNKLRISVKFLREHGIYGGLFRCLSGDQWFLVNIDKGNNEDLVGTVLASDEESDSESLIIESCQATSKEDFKHPIQHLQSEDICRMKDQGLPASSIIRALIENSKTFKNKTRFSQEKYIKKKRAKYWKEFTCFPVSVMDIAEVHFQRNFKRIGGLRFDYLSSMVILGDIRPGANVLILDQCGGLLTAAVLKRMSGQGKVFRVSGKSLTTSVLKELNLSHLETSILFEIPLLLLNVLGRMRKEMTQVPLTKQAWCDLCTFLPKRKCCEGSSCNVHQAPIEDLLSENLHAMLIAASPSCGDLELNVLQTFSLVCDVAEIFLLSGGRLALFSLSHTHLLAAARYLYQSDQYIDICFQELFLREYTVISDRMHPIMQRESRLFCGFLISCIKILS